MRALLFLLLLCPRRGDEKLRIDGPPFLALGESAEFEVLFGEKEATPVWRIADAPGGIAASFETKPKFNANTFSISGAKKIKVTSTGRTNGDLRLVASLEKGGTRIAQETFVVRLGDPLKIPARLRIVEHATGGSRETERFRSDEKRKKLEEEINAIWRACGIQFELTLGNPVKGEDRWFDEQGRMEPIVIQEEKRAKSPSLAALFKHARPGGVDIFVVHDFHWTEKAKSWGDVTVEHALGGVGLKEESALISDAADSVTLAHELGHVLGLDDLGSETRALEQTPPAERRRLMYSIRKFREGAGFSPEEMKTARKTAAKLLKSSSR